MNYRVQWIPAAEGQLASVWAAATDRHAVTAASTWLDRELARDPLNLGESRESPLVYVAFRSPLGVVYEVVPDDYLVLVATVFLTR